MFTKFFTYFRGLDISKNILYFGFSQAITLVSSVVRYPLLLSSNSISVLNDAFFWIALQAWISVLGAGIANTSRIRAVTNEFRIAKNGSLLPAVSILASVCISIFALLTQNPFLAGLGPTLLLALLSLKYSAYVGFVQGLGLQHRYFFWAAWAGAGGLALLFVFVSSPWWHFLPDTARAMTIVGISSLTFITPYLISFIRTKGLVSVSSREESKVEIQQRLFELGAVLPPAFLSGFDALALALTGNQSDLTLYTLISRLQIILTFFLTATYIQVANASSRTDFEFKNSPLNRIRWMTILNLPFLFLYVATAPILVTTLSLGKFSLSPVLLVSSSLIGVTAPAWIAVSGDYSLDVRLRRLFGRRVILYILPGSFVLTVILTFLAGVTGTFASTALTYCSVVILRFATARKGSD